MSGGWGYLLGGFLALAPLENILSQDDSSKVKEKVVSMLENYWNKEISLTKESLEKEISKWPQNLADYMRNINYFKTEKVGDVIASYNPRSNTYFIPALKINSDNFGEKMGELQNKVHTKTDLNFLKDVNYYGLALQGVSYPNLVNLGKDLEEYREDAFNFLSYSIESVSHEMTHRLIHDSDGLPGEKNFEKPSDEEFQKYVLHLLGSDAGNALHEQFQLYTEFANLDYNIKRRYKDTEDFFEKIYEKTSEEIRGYDDNYWRLYNEIPSSVPVSVNDYIFNIWKDVAGEKEVKFVESLLSREINEFELEYLKHNRASTYYILREKPQYEFKLSKNGTGGIDYEIFYNPVTNKLIEEGLPMAKVPEFYHYLSDYSVFSMMRREIEASAVSSLANIYFGPPESGRWSIDSEGCEYFSKFKTGGEEIFKRFIEKNEIARNLLEVGYEPAFVRKDLEFAKEYSRFGKKYSWPPSNLELNIR
ncbi:MAG: hypothetical protein Q8Q04_01640 [archaeon]|nr:hypothetical protein [archaeon]